MRHHLPKASLFHCLLYFATFSLTLAWGSCSHLQNSEEQEPFLADICLYQSSDSTTIIHPFLTTDTLNFILPAYWNLHQSCICGKTKIGREIDITLNNIIDISIDGIDYKVRFLQSRLNAVFISTQSGTMQHIDASADKSVKESGHLIAFDTIGQVFYDDALKQIKGRGNSSWVQKKKPYNITLAKKVKLFNLKKSKKFCLISSNGLTDYLSMLIAEEFGTSAAIQVCPIALYLNGNYNGLYLITNKVEIATSNVDITDLEDSNKKDISQKEQSLQTLTADEGSIRFVDGIKEPQDITGGYLLEVLNFKERYYNTRSGFIGGEDNRIEIKSPEKATLNEVEYIRDYFDAFYFANQAADGLNPTTHEHYSDYIDLTSFAKYYLVEEVLGNMDGGYGNLYFYKDQDAKDPKFYAGPIWDMGWSMGIDEKYPYNKYPESLFVRAGSSNPRHKIFYYLFQHEDFRQEVNRQYQLELKPILDKYRLSDSLCLNRPTNTSHDAQLNHIRWPHIPIPDYTRVGSYMSRRIDYMSKICNLSSEQDYCHISVNAGFQHRNIMFIVPRGSYFTLPHFDYWSLSPESYGNIDGWYEEGLRITSDSVLIDRDQFFQLKWKQQ